MPEKGFEVHKKGRAKAVTLLKKHEVLEVGSIDDADFVTINDVTAIGIRVLIVAVGV